MIRTVKMDRAGRIVIPRAVRERYGLVNGTHELAVLESVDGIVLRPTVEEIPAERHVSGWVVFRSGDSETVDPAQAVEEDRIRRHSDIQGSE